jgi:hypothetical protein
MNKSFGGWGDCVTPSRSRSPIRRLSPNTLLFHSILGASQQQKCFLCFPYYTTPARPTVIHAHWRDAGCSLLTSMERSSCNLSVWSRETSLTGRKHFKNSIAFRTLQNYSDESPTFYTRLLSSPFWPASFGVVLCPLWSASPPDLPPGLHHTSGVANSYRWLEPWRRLWFRIYHHEPVQGLNLKCC